MKPLPHHYDVHLTGGPSGYAQLSTAGVPELRTAPPVDYDGPGDAWSPEHLLLASVQACFLFTLRAIARLSKVEFLALDLDASGTVDRQDGVTRFTEIVLRPKLTVSPGTDRGASRYELAMNVLDRLFFAEGRRWSSGQARGDVLELAAGSGRNFPYYGQWVRLTAQDISAVMLGLARTRAAAIGLEVDLQVGDAQALDLPDAHFDTVVCTLGLCTIPNDRRALQEAWRVPRAGGRLLLLEHVVSPHLAVRLVQRLLDPLACLLASDHLLRDPLAVVMATGFEIERLERHAIGMVEWLVARKPMAVLAAEL